jgi:hypothetical protein
MLIYTFISSKIQVNKRSWSLHTKSIMIIVNLILLLLLLNSNTAGKQHWPIDSEAATGL